VGLIVFVLGIIVVHGIVAGTLRQMRRDGQAVRRYHYIAFAAMEAGLGLLLVLSDDLMLFFFLAGNAFFVLLQALLPPPRRPI
jgi:hypothetical protein